MPKLSICSFLSLTEISIVSIPSNLDFSYQNAFNLDSI